MLRSRIQVIQNDLNAKHGVKIDPLVKLKMWAKGFESEKYYLYNLKENDYKLYVSDYGHQKTKYINYPYDIVLHNKILFEKLVSPHIRVAKNYAYLENGVLFPLQEDIKVQTPADVLTLAQQEEDLIIKPVRGSQGRNVVHLQIKNDQLLMNKKEATEEDFQAYLASLDHFIITEHIKQDQYGVDLYPDSTNTLRILMMVDPDNNEPFIAAAAQRIGSKTTGCLDNFTLGGYSAAVDLATGELSAAITKKDTLKAKRIIWHETHPDTGAPIKGVKVPQWATIKTELLQAMEKLPYIKLIGWDVVLSGGEVTVIEGNSYPQVGILQTHGPLLTNPRVRRFYEYYDVIPK